MCSDNFTDTYGFSLYFLTYGAFLLSYWISCFYIILLNSSVYSFLYYSVFLLGKSLFNFNISALTSYIFEGFLNCLIINGFSDYAFSDYASALKKSTLFLEYYDLLLEERLLILKC